MKLAASFPLRTKGKIGKFDVNMTKASIGAHCVKLAKEMLAYHAALA